MRSTIPSSNRRKSAPFSSNFRGESERTHVRRYGDTAFTVIELLVVLGTIAILGVMLLPALAGTQLQSKITACAARYRQWAASANLYANDNQGWLPLKLGTYSSAAAGAYAWDVPPDMLNALIPYGMDVPVWFCPVRPAAFDAANAWAQKSLGHAMQTTNDLSRYWSSAFASEIVLNDDYWVPRYSSANHTSGFLYPKDSDYGWPQRLHDKAAPYVPFVSDTAGEGTGGGLIPNPKGNGVRGDPSMISPNTGHFQSGIFNPINLGYADGHVASHNLAQVRYVYKDINTGNTYWFY